MSPVKIGALTAYTLHELAEKFSTTTVTLRAYITSGKLKANKIGGRWYVTERAVAEFLEKPYGHEEEEILTGEEPPAPGTGTGTFTPPAPYKAGE